MMTLNQAFEYVAMADESESEQRAEYGMGCVSLGYDGNEAMLHYDGYRAADDPMYREARVLVETYCAMARSLRPAPVFVATDDIPF